MTGFGGAGGGAATGAEGAGIANGRGLLGAWLGNPELPVVLHPATMTLAPRNNGSFRQRGSCAKDISSPFCALVDFGERVWIVRSCAWTCPQPVLGENLKPPLSQDRALGTCAELGTAFVAFSPLGRGFLADRIATPNELSPQDLRRHMPRFQAEAWAANQRCLAGLRQLAQAQGCSTGQLALAWVLAQGAHVLAIPGTTQVAHLRANGAALGLQLAPAVQAELAALMQGIQGERYAPATFAEIDGD